MTSGTPLPTPMCSSPAGVVATASRTGKGAGVNPVPDSPRHGGPVWLGMPPACLAANDAAFSLPALCRMAQQLVTDAIGVEGRSKKLLVDAHECLRSFDVPSLRASKTGTETFRDVENSFREPENSFPRYGKIDGHG